MSSNQVMPVSEYVPARNFHVCEARTAHDDVLDELARLVGDGETLIHNGPAKTVPDVPQPVAPVAYEGPALADELPAWANAGASNSKPFDFDLQSRLEEAFGSSETVAAPQSVFETVIDEPVSEPRMPLPIPSAAQTADELDAELAAELDRALAEEMDEAAFAESMDAIAPPVGAAPSAAATASTPVNDDPFDAELAKLLHTPAEPLPPLAPSAPIATEQPVVTATPVASEQATDPAAADWHEQPFTAEPHVASAALAAGGSNRKRTVALAVATVALLGGGAAFALNFFNTETGPAPVIMADKDPVKVRPAETGGTVVPNQDRAVYREVEGETAAARPQETLADRSEEPIKVAIQRPENSGQLLQPRSVRTVTVRPDGTIVGSTKAAGDSAASTALPQPTLSLQGEPIGTAANQPANEPVTAALPQAEPAAATPAETAPAVEPKVVTPEPVEVAKVEPTPAPAPAVALAEPVVEPTPAPAAKPAEQPKPAAEASPFAVQISSQRSQAAAEKSYATMSRRYASVLNGKGVDIRRADITGKGTYYRVRIPAQTRGEANTICSRLKSAGGSCFVTR